MDIFSKRDGPRREDVAAKRMISENAGTIRRLADQISNGGFTRMRQQQAQKQQPPQAKGLIIHDLKAPVGKDDPAPYIKVSLNNRVVMVDANTGRQMHMLGEIRGNFMSRRFVLATAENRFITPLDADLAALVAPLADCAITAEFTEKDLAKALEDRIGLNGD